MRFAPQRRALFRHLNFQKCSQAGVLCTFWLGNALRARTAFTFSTCQLPKAVRAWGVFSFFTCKCASGHNGVHFSTCQFSKVLREWCAFYVLTWKCASRRATTSCNFSSLIWPDGSAPAALASLLFDPPEPQITVFRGFPSFRAPASSFFWLFLFSDLLSSLLLLFTSLLLIRPYCRKFDFAKLPSAILHIEIYTCFICRYIMFML